MINRVKSNKSNIMKTDDLESGFAVRKASVTESSAVSVESPCLKPDGGEKEKSLERTAGVAESSGQIQVSVKPKMYRIPAIASQRPTEKERGIEEELQLRR